jgi:Ice-binding-like
VVDLIHSQIAGFNSLRTFNKDKYMQSLRCLFVGCFLVIAAAPSNRASAQVAPSLGAAQNFAVLGGSAVTSTGPTNITGDLGDSSGTPTGFPPGTVTDGTINSANSLAMQAQTDTATAYSSLTGQACTVTFAVPTDIGGKTLAPGVYCFASSAQLTGTVTLDAGGNANAVWVFKIGSTLTTASDSSVLMINGGQQCKVFWAVGSSATLGTGTSFIGNILAVASITLTTDATVIGRTLAINGAVTLDSNAVSRSVCAQPDQTPPTCKLAGTVTGPPKQILISVQDTGSGLSSIAVTTSVNANTSVGVFGVGTTNLVTVTSTKVNQSKSSDVALKIFDIAGNSTVCDPADMTIADNGGRGAYSFTDVPQTEHFVELMDQHSGIEWVDIAVNGKLFRRRLNPVFKTVVDVGAAMNPGAENKITVWAYGPKGGSVYVLIHD